MKVVSHYYLGLLVVDQRRVVMRRAQKLILYRDSKEEEIQSTKARRRIRPKGLHQTIHPCLSLLWEERP